MVELVAEKIYDESNTVAISNGTDLNTIDGGLPTKDISNVIDGFTYIEKVKTDVKVDGFGFTLKSGAGPTTVSMGLSIGVTFDNTFSINIFEEDSIQEKSLGTNQTGGDFQPLDGVFTNVSDTYIEPPAEVKAIFDFSDNLEKSASEDVNFEVEVSVLGRKP